MKKKICNINEEHSSCPPTNLLFLHRLKDFDDASFIGGHIDAFKNLAVLAPPDFPNHLIIVLVPD